METPNEMRMKIVGKATGDADFRAQLLSDPKGAIEQELGVTIPASMSVEVHEESGAAAHLILPPGQQAERKRPAGGRRRRSSPWTGVGPPHLVILPAAQRSCGRAS